MPGVPRIGEFYGIVIGMYYREHGVPHFHATYAGETVVVSIDTGDVIAGNVPPRTLRLVQEWALCISKSCAATGPGRAKTLRWSASTRSPSIQLMDVAAHLHRVIELEVTGEHRLRVAFDDGLNGEIDASKWVWRGVFQPLRDPRYFAQVDLDRQLGTFTWPNGADVAPETLHLWVAEERERLTA